MSPFGGGYMCDVTEGPGCEGVTAANTQPKTVARCVHSVRVKLPFHQGAPSRPCVPRVCGWAGDGPSVHAVGLPYTKPTHLLGLMPGPMAVERLLQASGVGLAPAQLQSDERGTGKVQTHSFQLQLKDRTVLTQLFRSSHSAC